MWIVKIKETKEIMQFETMQEVAQWFNFFEDIYEDDVWDKFIEDLHPSYEIKWVKDEMEIIEYQEIYEYLNHLGLRYKGKCIYFGTTQDFCQEHNISEYEYYEDFSEDMIKLPKDKKVDKNFPLKNEEDEDDLPF